MFPPAIENMKIIGSYSYSPRHCIGQGSYGKVFEGQDSSHSPVAIKQMDLRFLESDKYLKSQLKVEIEVLKRLKHLNIVRLIDVLQSYNSMYIITEYCKDGDLRESLLKKKFSENESLNVLFQILDGFHQLISNGVIHRDLKPANILVHNGVYKIADFGFARFVSDFNGAMMKSCVGSPLYMAPQLLLRKPYTTKCDIWSLGIILYEMIFNETPWKGVDERDLLNNIMKKILAFPRKIGKFSEDILKKMLVIEEKDRISWEELFQIREKKLRKELEILDRENKPPVVLKENRKKIADSIAAEEKDKENTINEHRKYAKIISVLREDLCFKHYVSVKLMSNSSDLTRTLKIKGFLLEKFLFLCAQAVKSACKSLVFDLNEKEKTKKEMFCATKELKNLMKTLEKEGKFYEEFYEDLVKNLKNFNIFESLKNDKEIEGFFDGEINEKNREFLGGFIRKFGFEIVKNIALEGFFSENCDRDLVVSFDYMIDFLACLIRNGQKHEIDYEGLHREKSEGEGRAYVEKVLAKRNALMKREV